MARQLVCDICRKPCSEIKGKLYLAPIDPEKVKKGSSWHSNYSHHLDIGECCIGSDRILRVFNWRPRKTKKEASGRRQRG